MRADVASQLLENIPDSLVKPLVDNKVIGVVFIAVAFGVAARGLKGSERRTAEDLVSLGEPLAIRLEARIVRDGDPHTLEPL